jgi:adenylate cyclase, class 2
MAKEIELRIVDIDRKEVAKRLKQLGAKHVAFRRFRRLEARLLNTPTLHRWVRIRTDGTKTTFTMKENRGRKENVYEWEMEVSDFNAMGEILLRLLSKNLKAYIESERDEYTLDGTEITIDKWPQIPHFMEIEGKSRKQVNDVYRKLNVKGKRIGNIWDVYRLYGLSFVKVARKSNSYIEKKLRSAG